MSWRRILLLSFVLVVALGGVTWASLDRSEIATRLVRNELAGLLRPTSTIGSTSLELGNGRLTVHDLRIADPSQVDRELLRVETIAVDVGATIGAPWIDVRSVAVDGFTVRCGPTLPTAAELLAPRTPIAPAASLQVPALELRRGRVEFLVRAGAPPLVLENVELLVQPQPGSDGAQLRGRADLAELGARVHLLGTYSFATGAAELTVSVAPVPATDGSVRAGIALDPSLLPRLADLTGATMPAVEFGAELRSLTVVANMAGTGTPPRATLRAELTGAHVAGADIPAIVDDASLVLHASTDDDGEASVHLTQTSASGAIEVRARATTLRREPHLDVRVSGRNVQIGAPVLQALNLFDVGREVAYALRPTAGRADIELFLRDPQVRGGITELDLSLRDVAMSYHGFGPEGKRAAFPLPMVGARGRVRLRDNVLLIEDVQAAIGAAAGGTVTLVGHVQIDKPGGEDTTLDIRAVGVGFGPELRQALAALLHDEGALYDKFAPVGTAEVDVLVRPGSQLAGSWAVTVRPQAASMQWAGFPYRLDGLSGSVRACTDDVTFDLRGNHGQGTLSMVGHIPLGTQAPSSPGFEAVIALTDVAVDDELRQAVAVIAPELDAPWRDAAPSGRFAAQVKVWRPRPEDPLWHDGSLELTGVDLRLPVAPWRAIGLHGQVLVQGAGNETRVDFDALRGHLQHEDADRAPLAMLGHLVFGTEPKQDLAFVVRDLDLDARLGESLEQLQALGPGVWQSLQPSGRVDLVCRYEDSPARPDQLHLVVHLIDVHSRASILPHPAEHMTGELSIANGELTFGDIRAQLGGANFHCTSGRVHTLPAPDGRTQIAFTVSANDVPIDDGFANLFADPLHTAIAKRHPDGRADIANLQLVFKLPAAGALLPFETTIGGNLRLRGLDLTLGEGPDGIRVHGIHGQVTLAPSRVSSEGGALTGVLKDCSLTLFGHPFERVQAQFSADAERLVMPNLSARAHAGTLDTGTGTSPAIQYLLPAPKTPVGRLSANLRYAGVDVYSFLDTCGWTNPPYSGKASGAVQIEKLDGYDVIDAQGHGTVKITDADLGVVPLFTAIYAQLPASDRPRFNALDTTFTMADRSVRFDTLDVRSNVLAAKGKGSLGLDGYLEVEMTLDNLLGSSADPLVMPLIDYLAQNIVTFYLHGYLRDLRAEKRWITEAPPQRRRVAPMPPAPPQPTAPPF